jgi:hypothetical protein
MHMFSQYVRKKEKNLKGINWKEGNRIVIALFSPSIKLKQFSAVNMFNVYAGGNTQNAISFNNAEIRVPYIFDIGLEI